MLRSIALLLTFGSLSMLVACDNSSSDTPTVAPAEVHDHAAGMDHAGHDHDAPASGAMDSAKSDLSAAADSAKQAAGDTATEAQATTQKAAGSLAEKVSNLAGNAEKAVETPAEEAAQSMTLDSLNADTQLSETQAAGLIEKVQGFISAKNFDTAEQWISKLDGVTFPAGYENTPATLKDMLENARGLSDGASNMLNDLGK